MRRLTVIFLKSILALTLFVLLGEGLWMLGEGGRADLTRLRVGKIGLFTLDEKSPSWTIEVGMEQGFFQSEGLVVEMVLTQDFASQIEGLIQGDFEVGHQATVQLVTEIEQGAPFFMFMGDRRGPIFTLVAASAIRFLEALRGTRLGSSGVTGTDHLPLIKMLAERGLSPEDYTIVPSGNVLYRYHLLQRGGIAATLLSGDMVLDAENDGLTNLGAVDPYLGEFSFSAAAARRDWADQHPGLLRAYIRAYLRSVRWLLDPSNREQATNIMQTKARLDPEAAVRIYEGAIERLLPDAELTVAGIRSVVDVMVLAGLIEPGAHPPQKYVDLTFLTSVRNRLEN